MKLKIYHISLGRESSFNLYSKPWYYKSKYEEWRIIRLFGIYFWIYPKEHSLKLPKIG